MNSLMQLVQGSAHHLPFLADGSIHAVITSPPYLGLRKYHGDQDIDWPEVSYSPVAGLPPVTVPAQRCALGEEAEPFAYIGHLILCLREWGRVLRDDGVVLVNLGDSYSRGGVRRANAYGTSGKEPVSYQVRDSSFQNPGDGYHTQDRHISHTSPGSVPTQAASPSAPTREHTAIETFRSPTSDLPPQVDRTSFAIQDRLPAQDHEGAPILASVASTPDESSLLLPGEYLPIPNRDAGPDAARSSPVSIQASEHKSIFYRGEIQTYDGAIQGQRFGTGYNEEIAGASVDHISDTVSDSSSYLYCNTLPHHIETAIPPKNLLLIPSRFALAAQADGWIVRSNIIWAKGVSFLPDYAGSAMPESVTDRPSRTHEDIFLLAKRERYFWDGYAVREKSLLPNDNRKARSAEGQKSLPTKQVNGIRPGSATYATRNQRSVWVINQPTYRLRRDLTPEQRAYVFQRIAALDSHESYSTHANNT